MKDKRGFTLVEVLISIIVILFASMIVVSLFSSSLKDTIVQKEIQAKNTNSKSHMENAIVNAKKYSTIYEKYKDHRNPNDFSKIPNTAKPPGYVNPKQVKLVNFELTDLKSSISKDIRIKNFETVQGYYIFSNNDKYEFNKNLKNYRLFTFLAEGYATPETAGFSKENNGIVSVSDNKFDYIMRTIAPEVKGFYKVADAEGVKNSIKLVKSVRSQWYSSKSYNISKSSFVLPFTDDDTSDASVARITRLNGRNGDEYGLVKYGNPSKASDQNINANGVSSISKGIKYNPISNNNVLKGTELLNSFDKDYFFSAQTLNSNGYAGVLTLSYPGNEDNYYATKYYIGLPYIKNLLNHMDANLTVRPSSDSIEKNYWYNLGYSDIQKIKLDGNELINLGTDGNNNIIRGIKWKDVRDYTQTNPKNSSVGFYSLKDSEKNGAINFTQAQGIIEADNPVNSIVSYNRNQKIEQNSLANGMDGTPKGTIIIKFALNKDFEVDGINSGKMYMPYRLLSVNLDENCNIQKTGKSGAIHVGGGFQVFIDNNNKLKLNIVSSTKRPLSEEKVVHKVYDLAQEFNGSSLGLYDSSFMPYYVDNNRNRYVESDIGKNTKLDRSDIYILAIEYDKSSVGVSVLGYNNGGNNNLFHYSKKYRLNDFSDRILNSNNISMSIGGNDINAFETFGDSKMPLDGLYSGVISDDCKTPIQICDFLYYNDVLSTIGRDGNYNSIEYGEGNKLYMVMDYLYRKSLTDSERSLYDSKFVSVYKF